MKRPRQSAHLSESVHQRLSMYALAATAAGVGALSLASPAGAEIVYTPAKVSINTGTRILLDLNHDGMVDFTLKDSLHTNTGYPNSLTVTPAQQGNAVWESKTSQVIPWRAVALLPGSRVGANKYFHTARNFMVFGYTSGRGGRGQCHGRGWKHAVNKYLGLKFSIQGETHYGWARLSVRCKVLQKTTITGTLTGYAYETVANKAIITGKTKGPDVVVEPSTLGHLAQGAAANSNWRVKHRAITGK
jgi:hypothetical protein